MDDRIAETREALDESILIDIGLPIEARRHQVQMVAALKSAAQKWLDLLDSDALIIRRDEELVERIVRMRAEAIGVTEDEDVEYVREEVIAVLDALASSQGVEP